MSVLAGVARPASAIRFTISRCGYSIDSAGGIEPARPMDGSPLMYGPSGSVMPYGGLYFMCLSSRCASHRPADRQTRIIENDIRMCWLPTLQQAFQIFRKRDDQVWIDSGLAAAVAESEPSELGRADVHLPIVSIGIRPQDVRVFGILAQVRRHSRRIQGEAPQVI